MMNKPIPQDLLDYLHTMITPTHVGGVTLIALDLAEVDWTQYADEELSGLIAQGDPSLYMEEVWRVLKPGAHVMLFAPDSEPTGHTGTCALEDKGFEIRDAILWAKEAGALHYVPKASRSERNAGCVGSGAWLWFLRPGLDEETLAEVAEVLAAEGVDEDILNDLESIGLEEIPEALQGYFKRRQDENTNRHPTVKAIRIMEELLEDIPRDEGPVLDPFVGSGTTGVAGLRTGHDIIGIEKDEASLRTADQRVRHWDRAETGWIGADIQSDIEQKDDLPEKQDLADLFGFGD